MISTPVAVVASIAGSAALASWVVVCCRRLGPQTLRSSMITCAVAVALLELVAHATAAVAQSTDYAVALLFFVVPLFGFAFWSGGVLVRAFVGDHSATHRDRL
jgi:hypothetical protein